MKNSEKIFISLKNGKKFQINLWDKDGKDITALEWWQANYPEEIGVEELELMVRASRISRKVYKLSLKHGLTCSEMEQVLVANGRQIPYKHSKGRTSLLLLQQEGCLQVAKTYDLWVGVSSFDPKKGLVQPRS